MYTLDKLTKHINILAIANVFSKSVKNLGNLDLKVHLKAENWQ